MNTSNSIAKLAAALLAAQAEVKNPKLDSVNPHFKSKFASLAEVRETVLPVLHKHGLALAQYPKAAQGFAGCVNVLMHSSGEYMTEECLLPLDKPNAHGAGSCITYARRYSLQSIAGVVADEDDDANAAVEKPAPRGSARAETVDTFEKLPKTTQKRLADVAVQISDHLQANRDYDAYELAAEVQDSDEKTGLWSLLDSKQRNRLKQFKEKAELATQA
jgi:hypothetical protein